MPSRRRAITAGRLNGVQLWVALAGFAPHMTAARFEHVPEVPCHRAERRHRAGCLRAHFTAPPRPAPTTQGSSAPNCSCTPRLDGHRGPEPGLRARGARHSTATCALDGSPTRGPHALLPRRRAFGLAVTSTAGGRVLLIGGPPFPETILMWWNFVARTPEEIAEARADWESASTIRRRRGVSRVSAQRAGADALRAPNPVS